MDNLPYNIDSELDADAALGMFDFDEKEEEAPAEEAPADSPAEEPVDPQAEEQEPEQKPEEEPAAEEEISAEDASYKKRYADQQRHAQQLAAQLEAERKEREEMAARLAEAEKEQARLAGYQEAMSQQAQQAPMPTDEEIGQAISTNPVETFSWAIQNQPNLVPAIITAIRSVHGDAMADEAVVAHNMYLANAAQQRMDQRVQEIEAPQRNMAQMEALLKDVAEDVGADDFQRLAPRIRDLVSESILDPGKRPTDLSPVGIKNHIYKMFVKAAKEEMLNSASVPLSPEQVPVSEKVETSSPASAPAARQGGDSDEPSVVDQLVNAYEADRYQ